MPRITDKTELTIIAAGDKVPIVDVSDTTANAAGTLKWVDLETLGIPDGWISPNETLTYASATTFTCSATLAALLSTGDKIKLTQTTVKYFYVVSVSGTTVTITGGTSYTLANATITLPYYSKAVSPVGFPQRFTYTPTWTASANPAIVNGTITGSFFIVGKMVYFQIYILMGSSTTYGTGGYSFSLPITTANSTVEYPCVVVGMDTGTLRHGGIAQIGANASTFIIFSTDDGQQWSPSQPHTWANTDILSVNGAYAIA